MTTVTVRVIPRSRQTEVEVARDGVVVRVRAVPEGGRATEEARRALAEALGVPPRRVALRAGTRSRRKVFEVDGMSEEEIEIRLRAHRV